MKQHQWKRALSPREAHTADMLSKQPCISTCLCWMHSENSFVSLCAIWWNESNPFSVCSSKSLKGYECWSARLAFETSSGAMHYKQSGLRTDTHLIVLFELHCFIVYCVKWRKLWKKLMHWSFFFFFFPVVVAHLMILGRMLLLHYCCFSSFFSQL